MKTIQGKEFDYSDVLLYKIDGANIVLLVDDQDQMNKGSSPIARVRYSEDEMNRIIAGMKTIKKVEYNTTDLIVKYKNADGTVKNVKFTPESEPLIKAAMEAQHDYAQTKSNSVAMHLPAEEKEKKKKETGKNQRRALAGILAAISLGSGVLIGKYGLPSFRRNEDDPRIDGITFVKKSNFTNEGKKLFNDVNNKNTYLMRLSGGASNITWDDQLATEVVEVLNGVYPSSMSHMSDENAALEMSEVLQAIDMLIASNLGIQVESKDFVDLSEYVVGTKEKMLVKNASVLARNTIDESIGLPINGQLILEDEDLIRLGLNPCNPSDAELINAMNKEYMKVYAKEYNGAVDELLNYEYDTINDADYLGMNAGARHVIASYFRQANASIPQWSYITRDYSELTSRENVKYYRYFQDDRTKKLYIPREGMNGTVEYCASVIGTNGVCHEEVYSIDTMFAMAGLSLTDEERNTGIDPNPDIHIKGIEVEVDNRFNESMDELIHAKETVYIR